MTAYWTYVRDGEVIDAEYITEQLAVDSAQDDLDSEVEFFGIRDAVTQRDYKIQEFCYDEETDERRVIREYEITLEYNDYCPHREHAPIVI